jgi:hypothetical protein
MRAARNVLKAPYLPPHNAKYAVEPAAPVDSRDPVPASLDLDSVFCLEQERVISNDWVMQYNKRLFQPEKRQKAPVPAGAKVTVQEQRDGTLRLVYQGHRLRGSDRKGGPEASCRYGLLSECGPHTVFDHRRDTSIEVAEGTLLARLDRQTHFSALPFYAQVCHRARWLSSRAEAG